MTFLCLFNKGKGLLLVERENWQFIIYFYMDLGRNNPQQVWRAYV